MVELSTLSDPIKQAFYNADHKWGAYAEHFGAVADPFDAVSFTDNRAAIQAAIDWSAAQGRPVLFGGGVYGFDGTLILKSNACIIGVGAHNTKFRQLNNTWPDCFVPELEATTGVQAVKLSGFTIDGGWDKKASAGTGTNWDYASSTMTQRGLVLTSSLVFDANRAANRDGLGDPYNHVDDILIENIAGNGLVTHGRGEMRLRGLDIRACANWGAEFGAYDCWVDSVTVSICGRGGWRFRDSNQRFSNVKIWFVGMNRAEEYGVALELDHGISDIVATNICTQDTIGSAFKIQGRGNRVQGNAETTGTLYNQFGYGPSTRTNPIYAVELHDAQDTVTEISVSDRFGGNSGAGQPGLVGFFTSAPINNRVTLNINESLDGMAKPYDPANMIHVANGAINAKRYNIVETHMGKLLYGSVTAAELGDASHGVNAAPCKSAGTQRWDGDGQRPLWAQGGEATAPWVDANGQIAITPV